MMKGKKMKTELSLPSKGGREMLVLNILVRATPTSLMIWPPSRARTMRTRRAKTVPPGAAMEPRMVHAVRKTEAVVRSRVRE